MKTFLWSCAALLTAFVTAAECLTCNTCDKELLGLCVRTGSVNCTKTQNRCYTGVAKFNTSHLEFHAKGCAQEAECKNETGTILNVKYTITRECCNTNFCNGASLVQPALTSALGAALMVVWSQWGL